MIFFVWPRNAPLGMASSRFRSSGMTFWPQRVGFQVCVQVCPCVFVCVCVGGGSIRSHGISVLFLAVFPAMLRLYCLQCTLPFSWHRNSFFSQFPLSLYITGLLQFYRFWWTELFRLCSCLVEIPILFIFASLPLICFHLHHSLQCSVRLHGRGTRPGLPSGDKTCCSTSDIFRWVSSRFLSLSKNMGVM